MSPRVIPSAFSLLLVLASFSACDAATSDAWNIFGLIANNLGGPNYFTHRKDIEVIPSTADRKFSITVDGSPVASGSSYSVSLSNTESHTFEIVVSGPGHDSSSYRVHAKRLVYWTVWRIVITIIIITAILVVVLLLAALAFAYWKQKWPFGRSVGGDAYSAIPTAVA